jgi:hypothetical protein
MTLLTPAGRVLADESFPAYFVPIIPEALGPSPLPPESPGPATPGNTAVMTQGLPEVGNTGFAGSTLQVTAGTESGDRDMALLSSPLLSPPYLRPPTDTDLALASPFGGPGYAAPGRPRLGGTGRFSPSTRTRAPDLPSAGAMGLPSMTGPLTAGPLGGTAAASGTPAPSGPIPLSDIGAAGAP